jgi:hypothetical protein
MRVRAEPEAAMDHMSAHPNTSNISTGRGEKPRQKTYLGQVPCEKPLLPWLYNSNAA